MLAPAGRTHTLTQPVSPCLRPPGAHLRRAPCVCARARMCARARARARACARSCTRARACVRAHVRVRRRVCGFLIKFLFAHFIIIRIDAILLLFLLEFEHTFSDLLLLTSCLHICSPSIIIGIRQLFKSSCDNLFETS